MSDQTITCPNCKTEIKLTESLATPLLEATRKEFERKIVQKDSLSLKQSIYGENGRLMESTLIW
jgi:hypothetical protein